MEEEEDRPESPASRCLSLKSDRSKDLPLFFSDEPEPSDPKSKGGAQNVDDGNLYKLGITKNQQNQDSSKNQFEKKVKELLFKTLSPLGSPNLDKDKDRLFFPMLSPPYRIHIKEEGDSPEHSFSPSESELLYSGSDSKSLQDSNLSMWASKYNHLSASTKGQVKLRSDLRNRKDEPYAGSSSRMYQVSDTKGTARHKRRSGPRSVSKLTKGDQDTAKEVMKLRRKSYPQISPSGLESTMDDLPIFWSSRGLSSSLKQPDSPPLSFGRDDYDPPGRRRSETSPEGDNRFQEERTRKNEPYAGSSSRMYQDSDTKGTARHKGRSGPWSVSKLTKGDQDFAKEAMKLQRKAYPQFSPSGLESTMVEPSRFWSSRGLISSLKQPDSPPLSFGRDDYDPPGRRRSETSPEGDNRFQEERTRKNEPYAGSSSRMYQDLDTKGTAGHKGRSGPWSVSKLTKGDQDFAKEAMKLRRKAYPQFSPSGLESTMVEPSRFWSSRGLISSLKQPDSPPLSFGRDDYDPPGRRRSETSPEGDNRFQEERTRKNEPYAGSSSRMYQDSDTKGTAGHKGRSGPWSVSKLTKGDQDFAKEAMKLRRKAYPQFSPSGLESTMVEPSRFWSSRGLISSLKQPDSPPLSFGRDDYDPPGRRQSETSPEGDNHFQETWNSSTAPEDRNKSAEPKNKTRPPNISSRTNRSFTSPAASSALLVPSTITWSSSAGRKSSPQYSSTSKVSSRRRQSSSQPNQETPSWLLREHGGSSSKGPEYKGTSQIKRRRTHMDQDSPSQEHSSTLVSRVRKHKDPSAGFGLVSAKSEHKLNHIPVHQQEGEQFSLTKPTSSETEQTAESHQVSKLQSSPERKDTQQRPPSRSVVDTSRLASSGSPAGKSQSLKDLALALCKNNPCTAQQYETLTKWLSTSLSSQRPASVSTNTSCSQSTIPSINDPQSAPNEETQRYGEAGSRPGSDHQLQESHEPLMKIMSSRATMPPDCHVRSFTAEVSRSRSCPSLSDEISRERKKLKRSASLPDMKLKSSFEDFSPDCTDDSDGETYRFQCSCPGLYQCRETGLVFAMKEGGQVLYRFLTWNRRQLSQLHKKPAGPLFDIKCLQEGSMSQLHLPHCEIFSTGGCGFLSVAHVKDDDIEFIRPEKITETHVIIDVTGFSGFGIVRGEDSPRVPIRALVLLFYKPPLDPELDYIINVLLLPKNVSVSEVLRFRKKLDADEMYLQTPPHCKLVPDQLYSLTTSPGGDSIEVQPPEAEFDEESNRNFLPTFQVVYETRMKLIKLFLKDSSSSSVWERRVGLSASRSTRLNQLPNQQLLDIRSSFIDRTSGPVLQSLLDRLLEKHVITDSERESAEQMRARGDRARFVLDTVRNKGDQASSEMVEILHELDPFLSEHLGLI